MSRIKLPRLPLKIVLHLLLEYNPDTGVFTYKTGRRKGERAGYRSTHGYRTIAINGGHYGEHRLAWLYQTGVLSSMLLHIDHINQIKSDNRWCNLRIATRAQQAFNCPDKISRTGIRGVGYYAGAKKPWKIRIRNLTNPRRIRSYSSAREAKEAYDKIAIELSGGFYKPKPLPPEYL